MIIIGDLNRYGNMLTLKRPPDIGTRLGYPKYSKQFYRIKSRLKKEGIISSRGTFVESLPNLHMAAMAMRVDAAQISVLGYRIPYVLSIRTKDPDKITFAAEILIAYSKTK